MKPRLPSWWRWWVLLVGLITVALPFAGLIPLGALWLWQEGWLLWWLGAAAVVSAAGFGGAQWLRRRGDQSWAEWRHAPQRQPISEPDTDWSTHDLGAWESVKTLALEVDPSILADHRLMLETARDTIERVAEHYHPERRHPLWRFTVPEALLLSERVSARLRHVVLDHIPGSHRIHAGQLLRLWEFKPAAERSVKAFRGISAVYRVARFLNPATAILAETRGQVFSAVMGDAGTYLQRRGAQIWVEEIGRAAIELYSGRLRVEATRFGDNTETGPLGPGADLAERPGPLRIVIAGQAKAGKSSLVNALLGEVAAGVDALPLTSGFNGYELQREGAPEAVLIDAPGIEDEASARRVVERALAGDCILWVVAAHRADRAADRKALDRLRAHFVDNTQRAMPPIVLVASHVDRLSPVREWQPPYPIDEPTSSKAASIREAIDTIAEDLAVPLDSVVPVRLDRHADYYNIELLWALLAERFEHAQRGRATRIAQTIPDLDWREVLKQAGRGGLLVARYLARQPSDR